MNPRMSIMHHQVRNESSASNIFIGESHRKYSSTMSSIIHTIALRPNVTETSSHASILHTNTPHTNTHRTTTHETTSESSATRAKSEKSTPSGACPTVRPSCAARGPGELNVELSTDPYNSPDDSYNDIGIGESPDYCTSQTQLCRPAAKDTATCFGF